MVSDNIGRYWRDLARILGVKEAHIDSIELKDIPIKDKSFQVIYVFLFIDFINYKTFFYKLIINSNVISYNRLWKYLYQDVWDVTGKRN